MNKRLSPMVILILVLILGGYLRFANLTKRGIFSWDEGHYVGVLYTLHAGIKYMVKTFIFNENLGGFSDYMLTNGVNIYIAAKPTFFVLSLIATLFTGLHIYTTQIVSAVMGLLTIVVIYLISQIMNQKNVGIIASFMLGISYFHIYYSRMALPHVTSAFFAYLAVFIYIYSIHKYKNIPQAPCYNKYLLWTGVMIGVAFTCHYNLFWVPLVFLCSEILYYISALKDKPLLFKMRRLTIFISCMVFPLLIYEALHCYLKIYVYQHPEWITAIGGSSTQGRFFTYFEQIKNQVWQSKHFSDAANTMGNKLFYIHMIFLKETPIVFLFFIAGLFYILYTAVSDKFSIIEFILPCFFMVPLFLYSSSNHIQNMRSILIALPAYLWISAKGFSIIETFIMKRRRVAAWLFTTAAIISLFINAALESKEYINHRAGYGEAFKFIGSKEGLKHFSSNPLVTRIYAGRNNTCDIKSYYPPQLSGGDTGHFSLEHIIKLYNNDGFKYLLLDHLRYRYDNALVASASYVPAVFTTFHSSDADMFEQGYEGIKYAASCPKKIEIYRIDDLLNYASKLKIRNSDAKNL